MGGAARFEQQNARAGVRSRPVLHSARNGVQVHWLERHRSIRQVEEQASRDHQKDLVRVFVGMLGELAGDVRDLHVVVVDLGDHVG